MAVSSIAFTMYPVTDMPRAVAFYRDALGLTTAGVEMPFWTEFELSGGTFGIGNFEQVGKAGTAQSLSLEVDDLPAFRTELKTKGIDTSEPHETQVCWISVVSDPDGNQVWLHQSKKKS